MSWMNHLRRCKERNKDYIKTNQRAKQTAMSEMPDQVGHDDRSEPGMTFWVLLPKIAFLWVAF